MLSSRGKVIHLKCHRWKGKEKGRSKEKRTWEKGRPQMKKASAQQRKERTRLSTRSSARFHIRMERCGVWPLLALLQRTSGMNGPSMIGWMCWNILEQSAQYTSGFHNVWGVHWIYRYLITATRSLVFFAAGHRGSPIKAIGWVEITSYRFIMIYHDLSKQ